MKLLLTIVGTAAAVVVAQDTFFPPIQTLDEIDINIKYNANLTCAACIRGGYFYCDSNKDTVGEEKCCSSFFDPNCLMDFKNPLLKCMDDLWNGDSFNSLLNFCGSIQAEATCGNDTLYLDTLGNMTEFKINALKFGESCSYTIISNCGYPKIVIDKTDLDVVVAGIPSFKDFRFNSSDFRFPKDLTRSLSKARDAVKGQLEYTFGAGLKEAIDETCGKNRTLIVTISNLNQPTQTPTGRLLADTTVTNIGIKAESTSQPGSGLFGYGLSLLLVFGLSLFTLF
jgi:hypothetical protein